jgi:hypothetical protein
VSLNTTPRTWVTAEIVTAAELNTEIRDAFTGVQAAWTGFTPSLIGSTTNPVVNNGSAVGRYFQLGKTFWFYGEIIFGSTSTFGSGTWSLVLPFITAPVNVANIASMGHTFYGHGGSRQFGMMWQPNASALNSLTLYTSQTAADADVAVNPTTPWTWASADFISFDGTIESA